jgi:di/tricarboxylate transporter
MLLTFIILLLTILLFVFTRLRADLVALLSLLALYFTGILTANQALAGFADATTIMIAALFVVGEGLSRTGVTAWLGQQLMLRAGADPLRLLVVAMIGTALLSGVLSNTGTVAVLLPAVMAAAWKLKLAPSRFLMPMAIAANLGGLMTLIGSPPNIVVADTLTAAGAPTFAFFEFAWLGAPLVAAATIFMALAGGRLLRDRQASGRAVDVHGVVAALAEDYALSTRLHYLDVRPTSPLVGKTLREAALGRDYNLGVIVIQPQAETAPRGPLSASVAQLRRVASEIPDAESLIQAHDRLIVDGGADAVTHAAQQFDLAAQPFAPDTAALTATLLSQEIGVAEVLISPRADDLNRTVAQAQMGERYRVQVLGMRRSGQIIARGDALMQVGDTLLVRGRWSNIDALARVGRGYVVVGDPDTVARQIVSLNWRSVTALVILAGMVALMLSGGVATVMAVLLAAMAMVLTGCLPVSAFYRAINWPTVVLIAAMLPMSTALQVTGGAQLVADALVTLLGSQGPVWLLAGVFLLTAGFSQVMSNTATTVLVAPIVYSAAITLGVAPQPLLMMVAAGAAAAFITPIASPTNTLVFIPGGYTWGDYARVGLPLLVLVLLISLVVVPWVWPL